MKDLIRRCWDLYKKYEEGINYLIFGFLAFVLNYGLFFLFESILGMNYLLATGLSWLLTVIFAYWTNRTFVFKSKNVSKGSLVKEFSSFIGARIATEFLEMGFMYLAVEILGMNSYIAKLIGQVLVIVSNYFLSKLWIFKKK
ncbi:MAG: GtrA family protein [Lachnospiraceae bacterium]|nr:GtrA family protein [Lachnospiraceae bacterium]